MDDGAGTPNPDAEAATAELHAVAHNVDHPLHQAWRRNDGEAVQRHMKPFYDKITGPSPIVLGQGIEITGRPASQPAPQPAQQTDPHAEALSPEDRVVALKEHNRTVRETLGDDFETVAEEGRRGAAHLFGSDPDGVKAFEFLTKRIIAAGPATEVKALRALADLGRDLGI
jgi:hypothetical protein